MGRQQASQWSPFWREFTVSLNFPHCFMPLPTTSSWLDLGLGGSLLLSSGFWTILQGLLKRALNMELRTGRRTLLWLWRTVWRFENGINQRSLRLSEMSSQWAKLPMCSRWKQWSRVSWMVPPNGQPKLPSLVSKLKFEGLGRLWGKHEEEASQVWGSKALRKKNL